METAYNGKIARINLTTGEIKLEKLDFAMAEKFIGGRGLGTKILYDEGVAKVEPLSAENKLLFAPGALTGTKSPTSGRYMVVTKSPLTNYIASSNSGGRWGAMLKLAGWDMVIVEGKADKLVYLNIEDDKIEILPAEDLKGMKSKEINKELKQVHAGCSVLNIGPAGEKLSPIAAIMNDEDRAAGRSGVGAVMGSKNLKAIAVKSSRNSMDVYDDEALREANDECLRILRENAVTAESLPKYGTPVLVNIVNNVGALPTKNWQKAYHEDADKISGEAMEENILLKQSYCYRCPIGCGRVVEVEGEEAGGPEYEPLWAYGSNCGVDDLKAVTEANYLCNQYGLDAISAPCTIAAAMELYQKGYIKEEECDGVPLEWGSGEAIVEWTRRMGEGEGALGKLMARGSYELCQHYGHPEISMTVKKQEMPAYDARAIQGIGITYATSNRGGCHVRGYTISAEILGLPELAERTAVEGKAMLAKVFQDLTCVIDSMGLCLFTSFALGAPQYAALLNAATGTNYSPEELLEVGERIYNIERLFNKEAGMKPEEDRLPKRLTEDPIPDGPSAGMLSQIEVTLQDYYKVRGWEKAFPTRETLERLDLA